MKDPFLEINQTISTPPHTSVKTHRYNNSNSRKMGKIRFNFVKNTNDDKKEAQRISPQL